jgi:hypothetical protein
MAAPRNIPYNLGWARDYLHRHRMVDADLATDAEVEAALQALPSAQYRKLSKAWHRHRGSRIGTVTEALERLRADRGVS